MIFSPTVIAVYYQTTIRRTSLVVQGLKIHLPMQGTQGLIPGRGTKVPHSNRTGGTKSAWATTELVHKKPTNCTEEPMQSN